jgi:hypothetical protein
VYSVVVYKRIMSSLLWLLLLISCLSVYEGEKGMEINDLRALRSLFFLVKVTVYPVLDKNMVMGYNAG